MGLWPLTPRSAGCTMTVMVLSPSEPPLVSIVTCYLNGSKLSVSVCVSVGVTSLALHPISYSVPTHLMAPEPPVMSQLGSEVCHPWGQA